MNQHWCPLGFENDKQYLDFMDDLSVSIGWKCHKMQQLAEWQAQPEGFWLVLGGSATKLYSEGRVSMVSFLLSSVLALVATSISCSDSSICSQ